MLSLWFRTDENEFKYSLNDQSLSSDKNPPIGSDSLFAADVVSVLAGALSFLFTETNVNDNVIIAEDAINKMTLVFITLVLIGN
jgi:hypothetical protein